MNYKKEISYLIQRIKKQGIRAVCFWFPSYGMGGGGLAFYRLAVWLRHNTDLKIYYVDYNDGYFAPMLRQNDIFVVNYETETMFFSIEERCVVITNSTRAILLQKMRPDNKLLFWHWETVECDWDSLFLLDETQKFLRLCHEKHAMIFHDWSSWDSLSQTCGFDFEKKYLPVFIEISNSEENFDLIDDNEIHLTWIGRLVPDKVQSLFYLIDNLSGYLSDRKKVLHIIGDGRCRDTVEKYCIRFRNKIVFDFKGTVTGDELNKFLLESTDIVFAMGTSVLEGAARKIPTAVVLLNSSKIASDEFFWLYESKDYCCGVMCSQKRRFKIEYSHFRDMLDDIYLYNMKNEYGENCYKYYMKNHANVKLAGCQLLKAISDSNMIMDDLEMCIKFIPYSHLIIKHRKFLGQAISSQIIWEESDAKSECT